MDTQVGSWQTREAEEDGYHTFTKQAVECVFDQICSFGLYIIGYVMFLCFQVHFRTKQTKCFLAYVIMLNIIFYVFMFSGMLQYQTYKNEDPQQVQQKALPFIMLDKLAKRQVTELDTTLGLLTIRAAFFACGSCKYLTVPKIEERRTKLLCLRNIRFFKEGHLIPAPSADLESAHHSGAICQFGIS
jgi:hypothetical protein